MKEMVRRCGVAVSAALLMQGCVSFTHIQNPVEDLLQQQRPAKALEVLERRSLIGCDKVLYNLDKGMLLRMTGDFSASNAAFEAAKAAQEKVEAVSLTEQAGATVVNDSLRSYASPLFEQVMLHVYMALNFLELGNLDGARVEMMQVDALMQDKGDKDELPFARYLAGMVFEAQGEWSDALIAYRKAYQAYRAHGQPIPDYLKFDLLRLTERQGLSDERAQYEREFALKDWPTPRARQDAELIVVVSNGLAPRKHEQAITAQDPTSGQLHRIATPFYEKRQSSIEHVRVRVDGAIADDALMDNLAPHAEAALAQAMPAIIARAIARVAVKNKVSDEARQKDAVVGLITNIAGVLTERADTRGWYTLPQEILLVRMSLPPGDYRAALELLGPGDDVRATEQLKEMRLERGQWRFVSLHWPASRSLWRGVR
ncbi:MAG: hypothetical protein AB1810_02745 [Pseudomonadota bacterium]